MRGGCSAARRHAGVRCVDMRLLRMFAVLFVAVAAGVDAVPEVAEASLRDALATALEANRQFAEAAEDTAPGYMRGACEENARLREENAAQAAELEEARAGRAGGSASGWCSAGRRRSLLQDRAPAMPGGPTGRDRGNGDGRKDARSGGTGGAARLHAPAPVRGDRGISRRAGTAARSAGCRSRCWARITCRSSWTGR